VLHLEFQTRPQVDMPFRMLDYRVRVYRRYPNKTMRQVVLYLQPTSSDLIRQTRFTLEHTQHEFEVICLWEQPATLFLQYPGLLPFATLGQSADLEATLRQVAQRVEQISDLTMQANLTAASAILAGLRLEKEIIPRLLRRDIMKESVIYREIQAEAEARGKAEQQQAIALNLLREGLSLEVIARGTGLSLEQVQQLQQQMESIS